MRINVCHAEDFVGKEGAGDGITSTTTTTEKIIFD